MTLLELYRRFAERVAQLSKVNFSANRFEIELLPII